MQNQIHLSIAGFTIQLNSEWPLTLDNGFRHFTTDGQKQADITVDCRKTESVPAFEKAEKVFTSANNELKFYEIYRRGGELIFRIFNQQNQSEIQQTALLDAGLRQWIIWSGESGGTLEPLLFPMAPILLHYAVLTADAVMMHASGVFDGKTGRMFSGFSGAGKSTISAIWKADGSTLINDDRLIIRRDGDSYSVYNTPMFYQDDNKKAPLDAVYLIHHASCNTLSRITGATAVTGVMAFSIQNNYDSRFVQHHLDFFSKMCETVPVYRLGFVPDASVVEFIKSSEQ